MTEKSVRWLAMWHRGLNVTSHAVVIIGLLMAAVTLLSRTLWVADLIANLRVQLILGLLAGLACSLAARNRRLAIAAAAALVWQSSWLWSALVPAERHNKGAVLRICTVNVFRRNSQHDRIVESLKAVKPDVIAVLELGSPLRDRLLKELGVEYPYRLMEPQDDGNFGIGLMSRLPLHDAHVFHASQEWLPSIQATLQWQDQTIQLIAVHPLPPMNAHLFAARNAHLSEIATRVRMQRMQNPTEPVIVVGDLNLAPWSPNFRDFMAAAELQNASDGHGLAPTWYRWPAFPFGVMIDHGLSTKELRCSQRTVQGDIGSDHRSVTFEFASVED